MYGDSQVTLDFTEEYNLDYEALFWKKNNDHSFHQLQRAASCVCTVTQLLSDKPLIPPTGEEKSETKM